MELVEEFVRQKMERLEKESDWLAQCAANDGWHGVRVSREFMRDEARRAVDERAKETK